MIANPSFVGATLDNASLALDLLHLLDALRGQGGGCRAPWARRWHYPSLDPDTCRRLIVEFLGGDALAPEAAGN